MMRDIIGNRTIKEHFKAAIRKGKISHAYILEGEKGCGKKLLAENYARMLQCEHPSWKETPQEDMEACGSCPSCIQMDNRDHPDVIWVSHEKPNTISVSDIREQVVNTVEVMPYKGPYKIYIIDEAEKMNAQAQNAILKTIEEPPSYAILILLTTNRGAFLPTILSRCILLGVKPVLDDEVKDYLLKHYEIKDGSADFFARFAMGNIGKAVQISSSETFIEMKNHAISSLKKIPTAAIYELAESIKDYKIWKDTINDYFDIMLMWYRDLLVLKASGDKESLIFIEEYDSLLSQSEGLPYMGINQIFEEIASARDRIRANVNFETVLEILLLKVREAYYI